MKIDGCITQILSDLINRTGYWTKESDVTLPELVCVARMLTAWLQKEQDICDMEDEYEIEL